MIDPISTTPAANLTTAQPVTAMGQMPVTTTSNTVSSKPSFLKKLSPKMVVGLLALILTIVGGLAAFLLSESSQDIRQQASGTVYTVTECMNEISGGNAQQYAATVNGCEMGGGTWNVGACRCDNANSRCTVDAHCSGDEVCNVTTGDCQTKGDAIGGGGGCNINTTYSAGDAGDLCCVGGVSECKSGACSGSGDGTFGTCLGGSGGPITGPTCDGPGEIRCGGCGGFCSTDPSKTCNEQAKDRCGEVITGGSCAITIPGVVDTYDEANNSCTHYCTNIPGKDGDACPNVNRPCQYVGPENPRYDDLCPEGNGFSEYGWNNTTGCFEDLPNNVVVTSYYCPCPNNDCSTEGLGQGCQENRQVGLACYQTGTCGILQVDVDTEAPVAGQPQHTSRNKFITSGCNEVPAVTPTPVVTSSPNPSTPPPTSYFCNSNCTTNAQCEGADDDFICSAAHGNKCRLEVNPGSATCQPAVGPMCLSISMTNASNPTAPATADPEFGDAVTFTCGLVNGANRYIFRVIEPDGTIVNLTATGATSAQYNIDQSGAFVAQCQICTGAAESTCHAYEPPN